MPMGEPFTKESMAFLMPRDPYWKHYVDVWLADEMSKGDGLSTDWFVDHGLRILREL